MVAVGQVVQLDGSGSTDPAMKPLTYHWELFGLPAGSRAMLNGAPGPSGALNPSFVPDVAGDFIVRLTVTSDSGTSGASDVKISAADCAPMIMPITATPAAPTTGQVAQLATSVSEACDDRPPYLYAWHLDSLPAASRAALSVASATDPSVLLDVPGDYVVTLRVTDQAGRAADAAPFTLHASTCGSAPPTAEIGLSNPVVAAPAPTPPTVAARVPLGSSVHLDGSQSSSADNAAPCSLAKGLYYKWRFVSLPFASTASLNDAQVIAPTFDVDEVGAYVLELVVTDSAGLRSAPVRVQVNGFDPRFVVPSGSGPFNSLVLDPSAQGAPRIAYYNAASKRAELAVCTGTCDTAPSWNVRLIEDGSGVTPTSNDVGQFISMAVGPAPSANLYAAYYDASNCQSVYSFSVDHGVTWTTRVIDPSTGCGATQNGRWTSLALSPSTGNPAVAYQLNRQILRFAQCTANCTSTTTPPTWVITNVDATNPNTGFYNSLAFDPVSKRPSIAYRSDVGAGPVLYAACTATCDTTPVWATTTVESNLGGIGAANTDGSGASLAFSSTGMPSIAYRDDAATVLRLAQCQNGNCSANGWSISIVDSNGDVGEYPSLALSPAAATLDQPRITYRDVGNNELHLATFSPNGWSITVLDPGGNPRLSSLKLSAADGVRVSYDANGRGQLRFITIGP